MQRFVLNAILTAADAPLGAADEAPAALVAGERIEAAAVDALIRGALMDLRAREQQLRNQALDSLIADALVRKEAAVRGISAQALLRAEVEDKAVVGGVEAKAYYQANKVRFG